MRERAISKNSISKNSISENLGSHYLKVNKPIQLAGQEFQGSFCKVQLCPDLVPHGCYSQFIGAILVGTAKFMAGIPEIFD